MTGVFHGSMTVTFDGAWGGETFTVSQHDSTGAVIGTPAVYNTMGPFVLYPEPGNTVRYIKFQHSAGDGKLVLINVETHSHFEIGDLPPTPISIPTASYYSFGVDMSGTVVLSLAHGPEQYGVATGNIVFGVPSGVPNEASSIKIALLANGTGLTVDFDAAISKPSDSSMTWPRTMTADKTYIIRLDYANGEWCLVSIVGGF